MTRIGVKTLEQDMDVIIQDPNGKLDIGLAISGEKALRWIIKWKKKHKRRDWIELNRK